MSQFKESIYSRYSGLKSDDVISSVKSFLQYGIDHPLQFIAGTTFTCFAVIPVLTFIGFALGTLCVTVIAAIAWQFFLILCAIIGLAIALCVAITLAGCCTGLATILYCIFLSIKSSLLRISSLRTHGESSTPEKLTIAKED